ncbi:hypothetical protein ALC53_01094, partial [Atta colombica]
NKSFSFLPLPVSGVNLPLYLVCIEDLLGVNCCSINVFVGLFAARNFLNLLVVHFRCSKICQYRLLLCSSSVLFYLLHLFFHQYYFEMQIEAQVQSWVQIRLYIQTQHIYVDFQGILLYFNFIGIFSLLYNRWLFIIFKVFIPDIFCSVCVFYRYTNDLYRNLKSFVQFQSSRSHEFSYCLY